MMTLKTIQRLFVLAAFACAAAFAQTDSGSILVLVADASGGSVAKAQVEVSNSNTGGAISRESGSDGYATFTPMVRGTYSVRVTASGFQTYKLNDLQLNVDERKLVRVRLQVATVSESVEVTASTATIQSEQGSLGQVVEGKIAVELPLAARRYTELALLVPGATESTLDPTTRGVGWFNVNGNYQTQNNFVIEGVDNNQGTTNAQSLSAQVVQPSPDAIGEFKVQTNGYSAEFGRSAGAVVNVVLKSGTNRNHGSAWYYNRDKALAATSWTSNLTNAGKQDLQWNQFGGTFGGPIVKNKVFYFADYEGFLQNFSNPFLVTVPTAAELQGVFFRNITDPTTNTLFPNRTIPASRYDVLGKKLVDLYPAANLAGNIASSGQTTNNYGVQAQGTEKTHKGDLKGDYNLSSKNTLSMRWSYHRQDIFRDGILPGLADGVGNQGAQFNVNQNYGGTWTRTVTPSLINSFRLGYTRTYAYFNQATAGKTSPADFGFKGIPSSAILPGSALPLIAVSNYNQLGTRNFRPQFQKPELIQVLDALTWVRGRHTVKVGFETRQKNNSFLDSTRTVPAYTFNGNYTGEALADLMLGQVYQFDANTQAIVEQLQKAYAGYIQDDWKITPNVTLNLGMRYEYTTPYYGANPNKNINVDLKTGALINAKSPTDYLVNPDYKDLGPRIGMAWQILPSKLVFRGGFGIFYSGEDMSGSDVNLPLNPPQLIPVTIVRQGTGPAPFLLSQPVPSGIFDTYNSSIVSLRAREADYKAARVQQFNAALQYLLPLQSSLEVAYVGNRGSNLLAEYAANQTKFGVDGSIAANRPFPQWSAIQVGATRADSWYNSLQVKYEKRLSHGWYSLFSYTYASALDEAGAWGAGSSPQYLDNFASDRGPNSQTARHRATWSNVYELPFGRGRQFGSHWSKVVDGFLGGWQLSNILTTRTGLPVNVSLATSGTDPNTNQTYRFFSRNGGGLRPNRTGTGVTNTGADPKVNRLAYLNPAAFSVQTVNTAGNASRNVALGPKAFQLNLSLVKRFALTERTALDLRLEAFNAFNTVNFGNPAATFGSSNFGQITSAGDPRVVQVAIRYRF